MTFGISIKVNGAAAAKTEVAALTTALGQAETKGVAAGAALSRSLSGVAKEADKAAESTEKLAKAASGPGLFDKFSAGGLGAFTAAAAGLIASTKAAIDFADANTVLHNKLENVARTARSNNQATMSSIDLYEKLHDVAQLTRQDIDATTTSFVGLSSATSKLGMSQEQTIRLTQTINEAVAVSGASAEAASAGLLQLGQALSSGRLQGDEFRSISENLPYLRDLLAKSLGVGIDKLREMATEGKLTSKVIVEALSKSATEVDAAFQSSTASIGSRLTQLKNLAVKYAPDFLAGATGSMEVAVRQDIQRAQQEQIKNETEYQRALKQSNDVIRYQANSYEYVMSFMREQLKLIDQMVAAGEAANPAVALANKMEQDFAKSKNQINLNVEALGRLRDKAYEIEQAGGKLPAELKPSREYDVDISHENQKLKELIHPSKFEPKKHAEGVDYFKRVLEDIRGPAIEFEQSMAALNYLWSRGTITAAEYTDELEKLSDAYEKTKRSSESSFGLNGFTNPLRSGLGNIGRSLSNVRDGAEITARKAHEADDEAAYWADVRSKTAEWNQEMQDQSSETAKVMEDAFRSAFDGINEGLAALLAGQKFSWSQFVNQLIQQFARLALGTATNSLASGIGGLFKGSGDTSMPANLDGIAGSELIAGGIFDPTDNVHRTRPGGGGKGGTTINVIQDRDALLPALERSGGRRIIANVAVRDSGVALAIRGRHR